MNLNKLAVEVTLAEGGKVNLSIAQVKEVIKLTLKALKTVPVTDLVKLFAKLK